MKLALAALVAMALRAQSPCALGGTVTDGTTGKPLAAVRVFLTPEHAGPALMDSTNLEGGFCFRRIDDGSYRLEAVRPGYLAPNYGVGVMLTIAAAHPLAPVEMKMMRAASISGTVFDSAGEPVANAWVAVCRRRHRAQGDEEEDEAADTTTSDRGAFRLAPLRAGTYFLKVLPMDFAGTATDTRFLDADGKPRAVASVESFYVSAATIADARPIAVRAGEELAGIAVTTRQQALRHISGTAPAPPGYIRVERPNGSTFPLSVEADGSFYRSGLAPGRYTLEAFERGRVAGRREVDLSAGDADGITLTATDALERGIAVSIEFRWEGGAREEEPLAMLTSPSGSQLSRRGGPGTASFPELRPGVYRLYVWGLQRSYLKRVLLDGEPAAAESLDLRHAAKLTAILGAESASIGGQVAHEQAIPEAISVIAVRADGSIAGRATADQEGRFRMEHLAPCQCRVFAIQVLDDEDWAPEVAAALGAKSRAVDLKEGERSEVELPLISAKEMAAALEKAGQ